MNQATQALQTIADLRAENRELRAERDRYEKALCEIAGADSGVWGRIAHAALRGKR